MARRASRAALVARATLLASRGAAREARYVGALLAGAKRAGVSRRGGRAGARTRAAPSRRSSPATRRGPGVASTADALGWLDAPRRRDGRAVERAVGFLAARRSATAAGAIPPPRTERRTRSRDARVAALLARCAFARLSALRRAAAAPRPRAGRPSACRAASYAAIAGYLALVRQRPRRARRRRRGAPVVRPRARARLPHAAPSTRVRDGARASRSATRRRCRARGSAPTRSRARCSRAQAADGGFGAGAGARARRRALAALARSPRWLAALGCRLRVASRRPMLNLAAIHEAIAAVVPERECLVFRDRRLTWARGHRAHAPSRRRAARARARLPPRARRRSRADESGQDHVALYLYNGNEYLEGMLGAFKARVRAVQRELPLRRRGAALPVSTTRDARAVVYHARFAPMLARIRARLPQVRLWLQVADESGEPLLPGALDYEAALAAATPAPPRGPLARRPLHPLHRRHDGHAEGRALAPGGHLPRGALRRAPSRATRGARRARARAARALRALPAPPFMHGAAHWVAFSMWHVGGTDRRAVADRDARPRRHLVDRRARARRGADDRRRRLRGGRCSTRSRAKTYDLSSLRLRHVGRRDPHRGAEGTSCCARLPDVRILDALGSSESGAQASQFIARRRRRRRPATSSSRADNAVLDEDSHGRLAPGAARAAGSRARGHVPLGYYKDAEKTARTFPVVDGVRYAVPGDRAIARGGRQAAPARPRLASRSTPAARRSSPRRSSTR